MGQSLASFVTPVGQEKYYVFLICSQEKHLHFQEKSQEKSGKNIRQDVYEPCRIGYKISKCAYTVSQL